MTLLEQFGHGGDLLTATNVFGLEGKKVLDFSANINPLGPPQSVMEGLKNQLESIIHYPDPGQRKLKNKLAEVLSVPSSQLVIGNGAAECMALVLLALKPKTVGVVYPCFSEYEQLSKAFGAKVEGCYGRDEDDLKPDMVELLRLISKVNLLFIGHPNNPTGTAYTLDELKQIADSAEKANTYVVIDEAFIDFLANGSDLTLLPYLENYQHMIIIRSMTKFYAIPGLRLGYAIANPELIGKMIVKQVTWSVNQLALMAGEYCLNEKAYADETITLITEQRQYVKSKIERELGWYVFDGQANYLLVRSQKTMQAQDLQWKLGQKGILIRSCSMYKGLTEHDFRIAIRSQEENNVLLHALMDVKSKGCERV